MVERLSCLVGIYFIIFVFEFVVFVVIFVYNIVKRFGNFFYVIVSFDF